MAQIDSIRLSRDPASAPQSAELLQLSAALRNAYEIGQRIRAKMRRNFDDSGGAGGIDWAQVQSLWGIPAGNTNTGATAQGSVVFTLIDGFVGSMEGSFQTPAGRDLTERII